MSDLSAGRLFRRILDAEDDASPQSQLISLPMFQTALAEIHVDLTQVCMGWCEGGGRHGGARRVRALDRWRAPAGPLAMTASTAQSPLSRPSALSLIR